ncbi:MATE family efflux transporter [Thioclava sp. GXIMD2076]|uniref:MATE family efflux transporter n=1 Tax=Thioclava sp. GXIMD2076 TaxID=3131931 RepID=UPI0030CAAC34
MAPPDLSDPDLPRLARKLGLPVMAGLSLNALHQVVDAGFVARLGTEPLAVLSLMAPLAGLVAALGIGIGIGAASLTARALGAADTQMARAVAGLALVTALGLAAGLCSALWLAQAPVLGLLGLEQTDPLAGLARGYFPFLILTMAGSLMQIQCDFLAIGRGASATSLKLLALCFGLNIALDPLFIFGLGYGLEGAAIATLCAQSVTLGAWALWFAPLSRRPCLDRIAPLADMARIGLPEAGSVLLTTLSMMAVLHLALVLGDTATLAALGLALRLLLIVQLPMEGFALGLQPLLAHAIGARDPARLRAVFRYGLRALIGAGAGMCVAILLLAPLLAALLAPGPDLAGQTIPLLRWLALGLPALALRLQVQILLQARIDPLRASCLGLAPAGWLLWPLLALMLPLLGVAGLAPALTLAALLGGALALWMMRSAPTPFQPREMSHDPQS